MATDNLKFIPSTELATSIFEEIATSASQIDTFFYHLPVGDRGEEDEKLNNQLDIVRTMVSRIGWLADLGCKKLTGSESIKGDAEYWLMHPVYIQDLEKETGTS